MDSPVSGMPVQLAFVLERALEQHGLVQHELEPEQPLMDQNTG